MPGKKSVSWFLMGTNDNHFDGGLVARRMGDGCRKTT